MHADINDEGTGCRKSYWHDGGREPDDDAPGETNETRHGQSWAADAQADGGLLDEIIPFTRPENKPCAVLRFFSGG